MVRRGAEDAEKNKSITLPALPLCVPQFSSAASLQKTVATPKDSFGVAKFNFCNCCNCPVIY
jgi:hypothetical protein